MAKGTDSDNKARSEAKISDNQPRRYWTRRRTIRTLVAVIVAIGTFFKIVNSYNQIFNFFQHHNIIDLIDSIGVRIALATLAFVGIILVVNYLRKPSPAPKWIYAVFIASILFTVVAIFPSNKREGKYIIVYDYGTQPFHPHTLLSSNIEQQNLADISKLISMNAFQSNDVLISTVPNPTVAWNKSLDPGQRITLSTPILSLQDVLDENNENFLDLSFSNFEADITNFIKSEYPKSTEVRIFFEPEYSSADEILRNYFNKGIPEFEITSIIYSFRAKKPLTSSKAVVVFLGSARALQDFLDKTNPTDYRRLIAPNWVRQSIKPETTAPNRVCIVSSVFNNLVNGDHDTWNILLTGIQDKSGDNQNLQDHVLSRFARNNQVQVVNF